MALNKSNPKIHSSKIVGSYLGATCEAQADQAKAKHPPYVAPTYDQVLPHEKVKILDNSH